jgi:hypothetical protein
VADRHRERVGGVVGRRRLGQREDGLDHADDLVLGRPARAADGALDLLGRVVGARDAPLAGGEHDHAAGLADGERRHRVGAEVQVLDGHGGGRVLVEQVADAGEDGGQPALERQAGGRLHHAAVERGHPPAAAGDDAVARVGGAGVDAEDDHGR